MNKYIVYFLLFTCILSFYLDYHLVVGHKGIDLRDKVVASRTLFSEKSMYYSWWKEGESLYYYDYADLQSTELSRFTGTPIQALIMKPISYLSYDYIKLLNYTLAWVSFFFILKIFVKDNLARMGFIIVFTFMPFWVYHIYNGQIYIHYLAVIVLASFLYHKKRYKLSAILFTIVIFCKPTFVVFIIPLIKDINRKYLIFFIFTTIVISIFSYSFLKKDWSEYFVAMEKWSYIEIREDFPNPKILEFKPKINFAQYNPPMKIKIRYIENTSIQELFENAFDIKISPRYYQFASIFLLLCFILISLFIEFTLISGIAYSCLVYSILSITMPFPKFSYQCIFYIVPIIYFWSEKIKSISLKLIVGIGIVFLFLVHDIVSRPTLFGEFFLCLGLGCFFMSRIATKWEQ